MALTLGRRLWARAVDVASLGRLRLSDARGCALLRRLRRERLTYLRPSALVDLYDAVVDVERRRLPGTLIEAGCALGGSAIAIAAAKAQSRPLLVYDAFGMIPPPTEQDGPDGHARYAVIASGTASGIGGDGYYGYRHDLLTAVAQAFARYGFDPEENGVRLLPGLYEDSLRPTEPVALAHIDCDWYDSVMVCLRRIEPLLVVGGTLIVDDYFDWSGCRRAVDEYFAAKHGAYRFTARASLHLQRLR
ncbi:MAG: TylF/MycF/NovP-related O-methyltransferase [Anaerolineae bacterium]